MATPNCNQRGADTVERRWGHERVYRGQCLCLSADLEHLLFSGREFDRRRAWLAQLQHDCGRGMCRQANAIRAKLIGGVVRDMKIVTNVDSSGEPRGSGVKKPYKAPSFRFELVFELSALACGM